MKKPNVIILTALSFNKTGNQSLRRFVEMFLQNNFVVDLYSSKFDFNEVHYAKSKNLRIHKIISILGSEVLRPKTQATHASNDYDSTIKSEDIITPYGQYNLTTIIRKWSLYLLQLTDNLMLFLYFVTFKASKIREAGLIIGYECGYTLCAIMLAIVFNKKYINKFQGTILKSTQRNILKCILFHPHNFLGINKSDLCLMVNDGTDGKYYARLRGCKNIFFEPHGVANKEYQLKKQEENYLLTKYIKPYKNKFIFFNNASTSRWKRVDRIIRALKQLKPRILRKIVLLTTYNADDKDLLINYTKKLKLDKYVIFLDKIDSLTSNFLIQNSDVLVMTNDVSNLGNPVLEAVYYKTPVISINDGSLDGFITNGKDSVLINLNRNFDKNLAGSIERTVTDKKYYNYLRNNLIKNESVHSLDYQQKEELKAIIEANKTHD